MTTINQVKQTTLATGVENFFTPGDDLYRKIAMHNGGLTMDQVRVALDKGHVIYTTFSKFQMVEVTV